MEQAHEQYLTFFVDGEEFAVGILQVKEIITWDAVTRVPRTAPFIRGVINLRGSVVPVIDLTMKFCARAGEVTRSTCIVIVEVTIANETAVVGLMVDAVSHVIELASADIEPPPQFGTLRTDFLLGMARSEEGKKFVLILDLDGVLTAADGEQVLETAEIRDELIA